MPRLNRLTSETSPYLREHEANPVDWWPWGGEALAEAQRTHRPILLSVGYAACHWCKVMAHESFEDEATAAYMNAEFVNIKVDREERPDIDSIYMSALQHLGERGGWPLTMFLTPAGEPFWGGTYFPKEGRFGKPSFMDVLQNVVRIFRDEPQSVERNRGVLMRRLAADHTGGRGVIGVAELNSAAVQLLGAIDPVNGGLKGGRKFPNAMLIECLQRAARRTGDKPSQQAASLTLQKICDGGIYDHLGGGFSRYAVDDAWRIPHFEKMLYDNALLLEQLALAQQTAPMPVYRRRAEDTVAWLFREMLAENGAFATSLAADSDGEEGGYYVWTKDDIERVLAPNDAASFCAIYGVTSDGNFEGRNVLYQAEQSESLMEETPQRLAEFKQTLLAERCKRLAPARDDKILADWNGFAIVALVRAAVAFSRPDWLDRAKAVFNVVEGLLVRGGRLGHSWCDHRLTVPGLASDYGSMIRAALALFEATQDGSYASCAVAWQADLDKHYLDAKSSAYFLTADDAVGLVLRPQVSTDDAMPNYQATIVENLIKLSLIAGDSSYLAKADRLLAATLPRANDNPLMHFALWNAFDFRLFGAEIVVVGDKIESQPLFDAALRIAPAERTVLRVNDPNTLTPGHPARAKIGSVSQAAAFICAGERCSLPVIDAAQLQLVHQQMTAGAS